jgi:MFS family permease
METKKQEDIRLPGSPEPGNNEPRGSFHSVLMNRSFVLVWLAQLLSQISFNAANAGVITTVTDITGSAFMVGISIICFTFPAVPFSLLAGVYTDYLNKRMVMWVSNALRAVLSFLIVVALVWNPHTVIPLFGLTFLISMITQFFMPAEASSIPLLVGKKNLVPALSLFNITLNISQAIGFLLLARVIESIFSAGITLPLGVTRVTVTPHNMLFVVVSVGYILSALLVLAIPRAKLQALTNHGTKLPKSPGKEMWAIVQRDVKGSWKVIRKDKSLFLSIIQVSFVSILLLVVAQLAGPFVQTFLHLPADDLTLLFAPAGVGLVLGGVLMPFITRYLRKNVVIVLGSIFTSLGLVLMPLSQVIIRYVPALQPWSIFIIGILAFILGVALDLINVPAQTVMQERAPAEERARVLSFQFMLYNAGSIPVLMFIGVIGQTLGIDTVMYFLGLAVLMFLWWTIRYERLVRNQVQESYQADRLRHEA